MIQLSRTRFTGFERVSSVQWGQQSGLLCPHTARCYFLPGPAMRRVGGARVADARGKGRARGHLQRARQRSLLNRARSTLAEHLLEMWAFGIHAAAVVQRIAMRSVTTIATQTARRHLRRSWCSLQSWDRAAGTSKIATQSSSGWPPMCMGHRRSRRSPRR